jgi:amino acid transporter
LDNETVALKRCGFIGALLASLVIGIFVACLMEVIAEMVIRWPIATHTIEFVKAFVDEELAIVVKIACWWG